MGKLLYTLSLVVCFSSFGQKGIYFPGDDVLSIEIPTKIDKLYGYPSNDELHPEAVEYYNLATPIIASQPNQAILLFKKAINKDPHFVQAIDNLAKTYRFIEEYNLAIEYYLLSQKIFPKGNTAYQNLAVVYCIQKQWNKAIEQYNILISNYPNDPEGYYGLAQVYLNIEDDSLVLALKNAKKALSLYLTNPTNYISDSYLQVGLIHYYRKEKNLAKKYLKNAKKKFDENDMSERFSEFDSILESLYQTN